MNQNNGWIAWVIGILAVLVVVIIVLVTQTPNKTTETPTAITPTTTVNVSTVPSRTPSAPIAATSLNASATDTTVIIKATVTPNGAFTNYWYEFGTTTQLGNSTSKQSVGSGFVVMAAPGYITGLTKDTVYYYRVTAENQIGRDMGEIYSFKTTHGNPPPVGGVPVAKTIDASQITRSEAIINGEVTPNRSTSGYWFEYGKSTNLGNTTDFVSVGDGTTRVLANTRLTFLQPATTYYFRIDAQNQFGTVQGTILSFKTSGPADAPEVLPTASTGNTTSVQATTATIRGTVNPNGNETSYWFEYGVDSVAGSLLTNTTDHTSAGSGSNGLSTKADLTRLTSNTTYYYQLVAQSSAGTVRGDRMSFKTK